MTSRTLLGSLIALVLMSGSADVSLAAVVYVDANATGSNNGSNWDDAYVQLQDALAAADPGDQLWIATGTYLPDHGGGEVPGDRSALFQLRAGTGIYGGFAGGEIKLEDRDWLLNKAILSGDLLGDDEPNFQNFEENSYHVVAASGVPTNTVLDGVTVTGGNADGAEAMGKGGGVYSLGGAPTYANCLIMLNQAVDEGGGVYYRGGSPDFASCTISNNHCEGAGGGVAIFKGTPSLSNCIIEYNEAGGSGGGIVNYFHTTLSLTGCTFRGNLTAGYGGGLSSGLLGDAVIRQCRFIQNRATGSYGGGIDSFYDTNLDVANTLFVGNVCEGVGGGAIHTWESATLTNCTFHANESASPPGGVDAYSASSLTVLNCIFWGNLGDGSTSESSQLAVSNNIDFFMFSNSCVQNWSGELDGVGSIGLYPGFIDPKGDDGVAGTEDDDLHIGMGSPCIDAGQSAGVPTPDLDGAPRFVDDPTVPDTGSGYPTADMGAYEFQADCEGNGILDSVDLADGHGADCNTNGKLDACDLEDGTLSDSDGDGLPDQCRPVVYVKWNAVGDHDGSSWASAYDSLQDALQLV